MLCFYLNTRKRRSTSKFTHYIISAYQFDITKLLNTWLTLIVTHTQGRKVVNKNDFFEQRFGCSVEYTVYTPYQNAPSLVMECDNDADLWQVLAVGQVVTPACIINNKY